jgi:hypothetical protein
MDKVTVYATDKAPFHKTGVEIELVAEQAENFIKRGFAVAEKGSEVAETKLKTSKKEKNEKDT